MTVDLNHPDAGAAIAVTGICALGGICLAGSRWADTTTLCRFIARHPPLVALVAVFGVHLAHVVIDERRSRP